MTIETCTTVAAHKSIGRTKRLPPATQCLGAEILVTFRRGAESRDWAARLGGLEYTRNLSVIFTSAATRGECTRDGDSSCNDEVAADIDAAELARAYPEFAADIGYEPGDFLSELALVQHHAA